MKWRGGGSVCVVCVCMYVYVCVYDDLSTYLTKRTFSRFLSLLFLFIYLANQSTYLPTYLTLPYFLSRNLIFAYFRRIFFSGGFVTE